MAVSRLGLNDRHFLAFLVKHLATFNTVTISQSRLPAGTTKPSRKGMAQAICAAILPWVNKLAAGDWRGNAALVKGINVEAGKLVHPALQGMKL